MNGLFRFHLIIVIIVILVFIYFTRSCFDSGVIGIEAIGIIYSNPIYMTFKISSSAKQSNTAI
jgi:hypothetical protein